MPEGPFPHLPLISVERGTARFPQVPITNDAVEWNKTHRQQHATKLGAGFQRIGGTAQQLQAQRQELELPQIKGGVPFLLEVEEGNEEVLDFLTEKLGIEVVAEDDDGFLLVASEDLDPAQVAAMLRAFSESVRGSGQAASILAVYPDLDAPERLQRVLAPELFEQWPFPEDQEFTLEVSLRNKTISRLPTLRKRTVREKDATYQAREAKWTEEVREIMHSLDEDRMDRETALEEFVGFYQGKFLSGFVDSTHPHPQLAQLADSFSARVKMSGKGFNDLVLNFPYVFEVTPAVDCALPASRRRSDGEEPPPPDVAPPPRSAPAVCVIDSGIQENHRWLAPAIDAPESRSFLGVGTTDDVADYVEHGGHGTRVAGSVLYGRNVPLTGRIDTLFWVQNARLLDDKNHLPKQLFPPLALREVIAHFRHGSRKTRIYNHSIGERWPCRLRRMSTWAAAIDHLSHTEDVLFVQAAGNLSGAARAQVQNPTIPEHIVAGRNYPDYLSVPSSRVSNPAQSLQALTVGSVAHQTLRDDGRRSFAEALQPSAFTRTGFGIWDSIKPEVVEVGGDYVTDGSHPPKLSMPAEVCPTLVRSTLHGGPAVARDLVGTSFAAPVVTHLAGQLAVLFPGSPTLLYRALIAQSAKWPAWAEELRGTEMEQCVRQIGYGIPDVVRATENDEYRITLITAEAHELQAGAAAIFAVPIPEELRRPGLEADIRIEVTLSYSAEPRRTRSSRRGYLAVWLDWMSSNLGEPMDEFRKRALKTEVESNKLHTAIPWTLGTKTSYGTIRGAARGGGTLQKDWSTIKSYDLPDSLSIAVRGHKGWAHRNPDATARFSLVVTLEATNRDIPLYVPIRTRVEVAVQT